MKTTDMAAGQPFLSIGSLNPIFYKAEAALTFKIPYMANVTSIDIGADRVRFDPPYWLSPDAVYSVREVDGAWQIWTVEPFEDDATKMRYVAEAQRA